MKKTITKTTKYYDENGKITKEETETITEDHQESSEYPPSALAIYYGTWNIK